jgi:hypothetical protein
LLRKNDTKCTVSGERESCCFPGEDERMDVSCLAQPKENGNAKRARNERDKVVETLKRKNDWER